MELPTLNPNGSDWDCPRCRARMDGGEEGDYCGGCGTLYKECERCQEFMTAVGVVLWDDEYEESKLVRCVNAELVDTMVNLVRPLGLGASA